MNEYMMSEYVDTLSGLERRQPKWRRFWKSIFYLARGGGILMHVEEDDENPSLLFVNDLTLMMSVVAVHRDSIFV